MTEALETVSVTVPDAAALEAFEQALAVSCRTVGFFLADEDLRTWTVEGVKRRGEGEPQLAAALALAELVTGDDPVPLRRSPTQAGGWLARTQSSFPEQRVGRRFAIRGTHLGRGQAAGRLTLVLDAGVAFGSGEHGSTRGCLRALEAIVASPAAPYSRSGLRVRHPGDGGGDCSCTVRCTATDLDGWSVRVARENALANGLRNRVRCHVAAGWQPPARRGAPYDLVFANILARPLCSDGSLAGCQPGARRHGHPGWAA